MKPTTLGLAAIIVTAAGLAFAAPAGPGVWGRSPHREPGGGRGEAPAGDKIAKNCTLKGKKLYGKVKVVEHFPDFKVKVVQHFPDLKVQLVQHFPDACGKWQLVEHFPDFTVQYVEHFPDFAIQYVEHFPGLP